MPQERQKSPGSFQDELGGVIERVAPAEPKERARPEKPKKPATTDAVGPNDDRLFGNAWRKAD